MKKFWAKLRAFWGRVGAFIARKRVFYAMIGISTTLLVVAILVFGVIRPFRTMVRGVNVNPRFDQQQPIPFREGGLYGYLDPKGKILITPRFAKAEPFVGRYAAVATAEEAQIVDRQGTVQLKAPLDSLFYDEFSRTWLAGGTLYNADLRQISPDKYEVLPGSRGLYPFAEAGKHGVINARGKRLFDCGNSACTVEVSLSVDALKDSYALVKIDNGNKAIVNAGNGRKILEYGEKTSVEVKDNNIFAVVNSESGQTETFYRYIERNRVAIEGESGVTFSLFDPQNRYFLTDFGENWAEKNRSSRFALYRQKENEFFSTTARRALTLDELTTGYARSSCGDNKYGINAGDSEVLKCAYDDVELLDASLFIFLKKRVGQELVILKSDNKYTLYDIKKQKLLISSEAPIQTASESPFFAAYDSKSEKVLVYNAITGATEQLPTNGATSWTQAANFFSVNSTGKIRYFNNRLEEIRSTSPS